MFLMSDLEVFREVDEDYRRERMIAFWRRYGTIVLAAAVVVMLTAAGVSYMTLRAEQGKEADTAQFEALLSGIQSGNEAESIAALSAYAATAKPVEATLAMFTEAALRQREAEGRTESVEFLQTPRADFETIDVIDDLARASVRFLAEFRSRSKGPEGEAVEDRRTAEVWTFERNLKSRNPNWVLIHVDAAEA